jgi:hypothetical protein
MNRAGCDLDGTPIKNRKKLIWGQWTQQVSLYINFWDGDMAHVTAPRASDYETVCEGVAAAVRLAPKVYAEYCQAIAGRDKLSVQRRAHPGRYFGAFCEHLDFHKRLNPQQFKREGSFKDGYGGEVVVWTFKAPKWRVYGAILTVAGKRCFVGTRVDADKKRDKADQALLKATARDIGSLAEGRG